jgi:hypothetical protein
MFKATAEAKPTKLYGSEGRGSEVTRNDKSPFDSLSKCLLRKRRIK